MKTLLVCGIAGNTFKLRRHLKVPSTKLYEKSYNGSC